MNFILITIGAVVVAYLLIRGITAVMADRQTNKEESNQ